MDFATAEVNLLASFTDSPNSYSLLMTVRPLHLALSCWKVMMYGYLARMLDGERLVNGASILFIHLFAAHDILPFSATQCLWTNVLKVSSSH